MDFDTWDPIYRAICADFGYDRHADEQVAAWVARQVEASDPMRMRLDGAEVAIVVGAHLDRDGLSSARDVDQVIATGDALAPLLTADIAPTLVVTDLDSDPAAVCAHTRAGGLVAVHAHGDNEATVRRWVPRMHLDNVIPTTQGVPYGPLVNHGGFTDGDRAAYLADGFGAASLYFIGWAFDDPALTYMKERKLTWAARLLTRLEHERDEHYPILDGYRMPLDGSE